MFSSHAPSTSQWEPGELGAVPVADVLARQVPLDWPEAVAIVAELCAVLVAENRTANQIPDAADVLIAQGGKIVVNRRAAEHDMSYAARLLHALLAASNTPAPLRLFVSDAIASHKYESVETFGEALAYYERPGRGGLIQVVLQRFLAAPTDGTGAPVLLLPEEPKPTPPTRKRRRLSAPTLFAALFAVVALIGAAAFATLRVRSGGSVFPSSTTTVVAEATQAIQRVGDRIKQELGLVAPVSTPAPTVEVSAPAPARRPRARNGVADSGAQPPAANTAGLTPETVGTPPVPESIVAGPAAPAPAAAQLPEDDTMYSASDTDVTPPAMVSSKVSSSAPVAPTSQMTLELLVGRDGQVRQVRMLKGSTRLSDLMLLSAAKAWAFEPARRNGQPVNYRLVFDWTVAPR